jgi:hypothetical protein
MGTVTHLPSRPLTWQDIAAIDESDRLQAVPYGGIPGDEQIRIYAVKIATGNTAYALGFDETREQWQRLASADAENVQAADRRLDAVLEEWVRDSYGGQFEVLESI